MLDAEIESLLDAAGYRYEPISGRYFVIGSDEGEEDMPTQDVADQLEIPVDDLLRWEEEQQQPG